MPVKAADHIGHPAAIVAVCNDPRALVHDLHPLSILLNHLARIRHLRNRIGVAALHGHPHATAFSRGEMPIPVGLRALSNDETDRGRRIAPEVEPEVPVLAVRRGVDIAIEFPLPCGEIERFDVVAGVTECRDDPLDILEPEDHAATVHHRGVVRGEIELRGVHRDAAGRETPHLFLEKPQSQLDAAAVLEGAGRPVEVVAGQIGRDLIHVDRTIADVIAEVLLGADLRMAQRRKVANPLPGLSPLSIPLVIRRQVGRRDRAAAGGE